MTGRTFWVAGLALTILLSSPVSSHSKDLASVQLPPPAMEGGKPLMQVLKERTTMRSFSEEKLPLQTLSNLLWAAFGINRPGPENRRTAPSAKNWQEIDIYVAAKEGLYVYNALKNSLDAVLEEDIRAMTGLQPFVKEAPINLIYVADFAKVGGAGTEERDILSAADTAFIGENVYLYCASEGLATVFRASIDRGTLARKMKLRPDQKITFAQSVGYPKKQ